MFWEKSLIFSNNSFSLLSQASLGSLRGCAGYMDMTKVITLPISHWLQYCRMRETAGNGTGTPLGPYLPKMDISNCHTGSCLYIYLFLVLLS